MVIVHDDVQYHGEEVPFDLILSDIAEACGFECEEITVLPLGKGNVPASKWGASDAASCASAYNHWRLPEDAHRD